ncbi:MAG: phosphoenolpyruvate--protein phosphotransferase [Lentisphaeria bacterium]|nr:phosphoenolpyruvate--protein phosphotransferase [Lentisphaeria bacterium]NQZ66650.1 phosphoenolpyruvate--protein phosphotransferase [Lentisphaeria bacterium]
MENNHINLLCDISELSAVLAGSDDVDSFLQRIVEIVAGHINASVCSIYLFDDQKSKLYLKVTHGLNSTVASDIELSVGEGLVGHCFQEMEAVLENKASTHPKFKHFAELDESCFESFLAVPIQRGVEHIGVLVVQREEALSFIQLDVRAMQATASQLASVIENARIILTLNESEEESRENWFSRNAVIKGQIASKGIKHAKSLVIEHSDNWLSSDIEGEFTLEDFEIALSQTTSQLYLLEKRLGEKLPESASMIFSAHSLILKDPEFTGKMGDLIRNGYNPPLAVRAIARKFIRIFKNSKNAYTREKVEDIEDIAKRILSNLMHKHYGADSECSGRVIIAHDLYPSELLKLANENAAGIVLVSGGVTSHVSILARSLQIPMLLVDQPRLMELYDGTDVLLDAEMGTFYINPSDEIITLFKEREQAKKRIKTARMTTSSKTKCGESIALLANINLLSDLKTAAKHNAEGIGLYRTEFPFLIRSDFPSETEQESIYKRLFSSMPDKVITLRTLDIGGDKILKYFQDDLAEDNPVLGMRSIRFSLKYKDIFRDQIRAMLKAAKGHSQFRIMFPMISGLEEYLEAKETVYSCVESLKKEGAEFCEDFELGMMIEVPSTLYIIDELAKEADFFCIGTNDFIQFLLAVDRGNEKVADYYLPHHPSVLRALKQISEAAIKHNTDVSLCGEMANESVYLKFILGIGISSLSVDALNMQTLRQEIRKHTMDKCQKFADELLAESSIDKIEAILGI